MKTNSLLDCCDLREARRVGLWVHGNGLELGGAAPEGSFRGLVGAGAAQSVLLLVASFVIWGALRTMGVGELTPGKLAHPHAPVDPF